MQAADLLAIIPVAALAYAATNLDNLTLFVVLLTRYRERRAMVVAGYFLGAGVLLVAGYLLGHAATLMPVEYLGFLGLVPISVGLFGLVALFRNKSGGVAPNRERGRYAGTALLATAGTQLGNGADTIVTFAALFADSRAIADLMIVGSIAAMAGLFAMLGVASVRRPTIASWIDRYAHRVTPFILILVGGYILANTATDVLLD